MSDETNTTPQSEEARLSRAIEEAEKSLAGGAEDKAKSDAGTTSTQEVDKGKTFTQEDFDKALQVERERYSGLDRKLTEETTKFRAQLAEATEAKRRAEEDAFVRKVQEDGGDVDIAKAIITRDRTSREEANKLAQERTRLEALDKELGIAARNKKAYDLMTMYGLEQAEIGKLIELDDPVKMENAALKQYIEKVKQGATTIVKTDSGKTETKQSLEGLSLEERAGMAMEGKI